MLDRFCHQAARKEWHLFCVVALSLLTVHSAPAAPRSFEFGIKKEASASAATVAIMGEVKKSATYHFARKEITLSQLIQSAGGTTKDAGQKVRVVRGGRSALILLRPSQDNFRLSSGDVVIMERKWQTSARIVSFDNLPKSKSEAGSQPVVHRANYQKSGTGRQHGHIVLLGVRNEPVVLPLWGEELTLDSLLTGWLRQPPQVAAGTRIIYGSKRQLPSDRITSGMILSVPVASVQKAALPALPSPIVAAENMQPQTGSNQKVDQNNLREPAGLSPNPFDYQLTDENNIQQQPGKQNSPALEQPSLNLSRSVSDVQSSEDLSPVGDDSKKSVGQIELPSSEPLMLIPQDLPHTENSSEEVHSEPGGELLNQNAESFLQFDQGLFTTSDPQTLLADREESTEKESVVPVEKQASFSKLLEQKHGNNRHIARSGEVVPNPIEPEKAEGPTPIGFVAGAIVLIGVMTVIMSTLRNQLTQRAYFDEEREFPGEKMETTSAVVHSAKHYGFPQSVPAVTKEIPQAPAKPANLVSDPLTRDKLQKTSGLQALLENQIPVIEERVLLPREMKFFGKANLNYVLRIDASHQLKGPHVVSGSEKQEKKLSQSAGLQSLQSVSVSKQNAGSEKLQNQSNSIFWEAEAGLFASSYDLYQAVAPSDR